MPIPVTCKVCGKEEMVPPSRAKIYTSCSRACNSSTKKAKPNISCVVCGKPEHMKPYRLNRVKHGWTCSKECYATRQQTSMIGANNHQHGLVGDENASFSGEIIVRKGYVYEYTPDHPGATRNGRVRQHRLTAERNHIPPKSGELMDAYFIEGGRLYLKPEYIVHHIDEDRLNNHPDNLDVCTKSEHTSGHNTHKSIIRDKLTGRITGVVKSREFRETPEVDNPEPSLSN